MKNITLAAAAAVFVTSSAFAGEMVATRDKEYYPPEEPLCFAEREWQIDLFGVYGWTASNQDRILGDHAWGGGIGVNYFFTRHVGIGLEGMIYDTEGDNLGAAAFNVFFRFPMDHICLAPYLYAGVGGVFNASDLDKGDITDIGDDENNEDKFWSTHVGIGIEYRFSPRCGIFIDGRWTVVDEHSNNFAALRTGVRFSF
ncbi:MAG: porin family protein [Verrucomicrobiota bacterium]|nr:porin family protein [Verrucomicrobiota bacterium]